MGERTRTFEDSNQLRDWFNLIMGEALLGSPWVLAYSDDLGPAWTARVTGLVISALAIATLLKYAEWEEWLVLVAGAWLIVSPWAMNFSTRSIPTITHVVVGIVVVLVAAWELWDFRRLMAAREASARRQGLANS